jgi:hypothetical protein
MGFYKELAMALQASGRNVVSYWHALHITEMKFLGNFV